MLTAAAVALTALTGAPALAKKPCAKPVQVAYSKGWTSVPWPAFPLAVDASLGAHLLGIDPTATGTMYASDGRSLLATSDGGCTWATRFEVEPATAGLTIARIVVAPVPKGRPLVYLVLDTSPMFPTTTGLLRSADGGKTWARADVGLPFAGSSAATALMPGDEQQTEVSVAPSDGRVLYVRNPVGGGLWGSDDAGATWSLRHPVLVTDWDQAVPLDALGDKRFQCCTVDPLAPHDVWATSDYGVLHSTDGGKTFKLAVNPGHHIVVRSQLAVSHRPGRPAVVMFQRADDYTLWGSRDGGKRWGPLFGGTPLRWQLTDAIAASPAGLLAFATEATVTKVFQLCDRHGFVDQSDASGGWFNRYAGSATAVRGSTVTVAVVEYGYEISAPKTLIERRTFDVA